MGNTYIAVEGQHDLEFVCGLLKPEGFKKVLKIEQLTETFWSRIINTKFPFEGDLHKRVPNPMFLRREEDWIAVQAAGGGTPELATQLRNVLNSLRPFPGAPTAIGAIRDGDEVVAMDQFRKLLAELGGIKQIENYTVNFPTNPGEIADGSPRFGTFIFPDNSATGTFEDLLLECGRAAYPGLIGCDPVYAAILRVFSADSAS